MSGDTPLFTVLAGLLAAKKQTEDGLRALIDANQEPLRKAGEHISAFQASPVVADLHKGLAALDGLMANADKAVRAYDAELHKSLAAFGGLLISADKGLRELGALLRDGVPPSLNGQSLNGQSLNEQSLNEQSLNEQSLNGQSLAGPSPGGNSLSGPVADKPVAGQRFHPDNPSPNAASLLERKNTGLQAGTGLEDGQGPPARSVTNLHIHEAPSQDTASPEMNLYINLPEDGKASPVMPELGHVAEADLPEILETGTAMDGDPAASAGLQAIADTMNGAVLTDAAAEDGGAPERGASALEGLAQALRGLAPALQGTLASTLADESTPADPDMEALLLGMLDSPSELPSVADAIPEAMQAQAHNPYAGFVVIPPFASTGEQTTQAVNFSANGITVQDEPISQQAVQRMIDEHERRQIQSLTMVANRGMKLW